jgi:hypothetical protein
MSVSPTCMTAAVDVVMERKKAVAIERKEVVAMECKEVVTVVVNTENPKKRRVRFDAKPNEWVAIKTTRQLRKHTVDCMSEAVAPSGAHVPVIESLSTPTSDLSGEATSLKLGSITTVVTEYGDDDNKKEVAVFAERTEWDDIKEDEEDTRISAIETYRLIKQPARVDNRACIIFDPYVLARFSRHQLRPTRKHIVNDANAGRQRLCTGRYLAFRPHLDALFLLIFDTLGSVFPPCHTYTHTHAQFSHTAKLKPYDIHAHDHLCRVNGRCNISYSPDICCRRTFVVAAVN